MSGDGGYRTAAAFERFGVAPGGADGNVCWTIRDFIIGKPSGSAAWAK